MANEELIQSLREKGWSEEDIQKAVSIIEQHASIDKSGTKHYFNRVIYWFALLVAIIGNMMISVILIPFLLVLQSYQLYLVVMTLAISFGFLFNLLITDIEHVDQKHHIIAGIFIPALAIINVFVMTRISNMMIAAAQLQNVSHNPLLMSAAYVIAFISPYFYHSYISKKSKSL